MVRLGRARGCWLVEPKTWVEPGGWTCAGLLFDDRDGVYLDRILEKIATEFRDKHGEAGLN